ncbi:MAG: UbiA family prenyltransferase [Chloroflexi bacterium]|nr:UbiA family prenyltransferase [Chloroflexota bacterium]
MTTLAHYTRFLRRLFLNHFDAWALTLMIVSVAMLLHATLHWPLLLLITAGYWFGFALNDYFDAPYDAQEPAKAQRNSFVSFRPPRWQKTLLLLTTLLLPPLVLLPYGTRGLLVLALSLAVLWSYSAPPLRLKSRPGLDLLTHMLFVQTFPYAVTLFLLGVDWQARDFAIVLILALSSLAAQLEQQIRDYAVDARTDRNFTTTYGLSTSRRLLKIVTTLFVGVLLALIALGAFPAYLLPLGIVGLPVILHRFVRRAETPRSEKLVLISVIMGLVYLGLIWGAALLQAR